MASVDFENELKDVLLQSAKARNESPRMKRIVAGEESQEAIDVSVVQFYFHTIGFVRALRHLYARVSIPEFRADLGEGLYEEETGRITNTAPHLDLYFQMAEAFGFPREKLISEAYCLPETAAVVNWYHYAATSLDVLEGVAVLNFAAEGQNAEIGGYPGISKVMYDAMTTKYGKSHDDIIFYYVHDYADQEHSETGARNLTKYIKTDEQRERVRTAIQMTNDAWAGMSRFSDRKLNECWKHPSGVFYQ
ncbi:MAG: TenA family transcriptional regulator [Alphaproteobacteria bacterium]